MRLGSAGAVFINDTANANMTIGLTINQGTATNEIMNFKQNNVAHGVTTVLETDSFGAIYQVSGGSGGLAFYGITETTTGIQLYSVHTTDNTTKTTAGDGTIRLQALLKSGTGTADCGAGANLFVIMNRVTTNFIVGSDALHSNFALTEYDEYDDLSLIRAFSIASGQAGAKGFINNEFDKFVNYNEKTLVDAGLLGAPLAEGGLVNITGMIKLHTGAFGQVRNTFYKIRDEFAELRSKLEDAYVKIGVLEQKLLTV